MKKLLIAALLGCAAMPAQAFTYVKYEAWGTGTIGYNATLDGNWFSGSVPAEIYAEALINLDPNSYCYAGTSCSFGPNGLSFSYISGSYSSNFSIAFDYPLTAFPLTDEGVTGGQAYSTGLSVGGLKADYVFAQGGGQLNRFKVTVIETSSSMMNYAWVRVAGSVPEPGTWAMMIAGFGLTGFALRRRKTTIQFA